MEEKKIFRRFIICFVTSILCFAVIWGGFVILVDPFYHYHAPYFNIPIVLDNAVYQTAGAAKNLEYDSAVVGTSMTENMHTSWFEEEFGWNTMKLSYSGARTNDLQAIFGQMFDGERELNYVVMDINAYQLTSPAWTSYVQRPEYLYDSNLCNDYQYVYNHDVFILSLQRAMDSLAGVEDNVDEAYTWEESHLFGKERTIAASIDLRNQLIAGREVNEELYAVSGTTSEELEEKLQICQDNLDNILPYIENNPQTEFWIMFPPYSMLYWEQEILKGSLEDMIAVYAYAAEQLLPYENVKIYYFHREEDIITDLEKYRDSTHFRPEYNRYMFDCMKADKNRLTMENFREEMRNMYEFAKDYPYESLWNE